MKALTNYYCNRDDVGDALQPVTLLSYDRNKYCNLLRENGEQDSVKTGYLYDKHGKDIPYEKLFALPREVGLPAPSKMEQALELRRERVRKTQWSVSTSDFSTFHLYKTKAAAVKRFLQYATRTEPPSYIALEKTVRKGPRTGYSVEFGVEDGFWCSDNANLIRQFRKPLKLKLD